jgi:hypothetical protein
MTIWRTTLRCFAAAAGIIYILFGAFICFRGIQKIFSHGGESNLATAHSGIMWNLGAWAVAVVFILAGGFLLRRVRRWGKQIDAGNSN